ncbi:hypothetical protein YH67_05965 [Stenotrophomonas maltophilia]|jgi:hypothetical protein|uniref:hypothetical protein n=1 Tax=Stenotrophomonas geniculata TaxID=86188 RepID=UPI0006AA42AE|nr:hypothetical protein [uncultured Stenotrophomonas sp.]ALA85828.1 hypothetical protein YH67_05965 [Stenotrophomonas maltophilia]ALA89784.1 hypothetical protein YH68_05965 [Stenotrophomonas maltophilia]MBH1527781.1 hypothetical protein [Stenotrophomonas maltophilia]
MTYTLEQLAERLHACEVDLEAHRGYLKAMEYALGATIATHSDPPSLRRIWDLMLVEAADTHAGLDSPIFTAAFQQSLRMLTEQISLMDPGPTSQRPIDQ